jgi:hypothetical protein
MKNVTEQSKKAKRLKTVSKKKMLVKKPVVRKKARA